MQISYTGDAFASLSSIVNYIEATNTLGAGLRWLSRFEVFLIEALSNPSLVKLCHNSTFNELNLRCVNFNDWVVAFSLQDNSVLIEAILHKSRIRD